MPVKQTWEQTRLWQELVGRDGSDAVRTTVRVVLARAEPVLKSAGTAPLDFTLHDESHSFRVAERISELAGPSQLSKLANIEVALLLMSSYLHDIGMSPSRDNAVAHRSYLLDGDTSAITREQADNLQIWLDENRDGICAPIKSARSASDGLDEVESIVTYYFRAMHNEWGAEWTRANIHDADPTLYPGWIDDLVKLCKSHHFGIDELRHRDFDARIVDSSGVSVGLRYLAVLLRVADVLEFDPERTPIVVLTHRSIKPSSRVFWYKDHQIGFRLEESSRQVVFAARTPNAVIHKAVLDTADQVDTELSLSNALNDEQALSRGLIPESDRGKYSWIWPAKVSRDVVEANNSFVFIDGSFRPSPSRLLSVLGGTQLYGTELAAIREMLQNAVDAIRERAAYEELSATEDDVILIGDRVYKNHTVRLSVRNQDDYLWIECEDDGIGMTKEMISRNLLVSGSSPPGEVRALQRAMNSKGRRLDKTSEFGIGSLSYFMLADRVIFETLRAKESPSSDGLGWSFEIGGLGDFGELRPKVSKRPGTLVRLRVRPDIVSLGVTAFLDRFLDYAREIVSWMPCKIIIRDEVRGTEERLGPGWTNRIGPTAEEPMSYLTRDSSSFRGDFRTVREREEQEELLGEMTELRRAALRRLRWFSTGDITSEGEALRARVHVPFFLIGRAKSACFFNKRKDVVIATGSNINAVEPNNMDVESWRGFRVNGGNSARRRDTMYRGEGNVSTEVDFRLGRQILVSRDGFASNIELPDWKILEDSRRDAIEKCFGREAVFSAINAVVLDVPELMREGQVPSWLFCSKEKLHQDFLPVNSVDSIDVLWGPYNVSSNGWLVESPEPSIRTMAKLVKPGSGSAVTLPINWGNGSLVFVNTGNRGPVPAVKRLIGADQRFTGVQFPLGWDSVAAVGTEHGIAINKSAGYPHEFVKNTYTLHRSSSVLDMTAYSSFDRQSGLIFITENMKQGPDWWHRFVDTYPRFVSEMVAASRPGNLRFMYFNGSGIVYVTQVGNSGLTCDAIHAKRIITLPSSDRLEIPSEILFRFRKLESE